MKSLEGVSVFFTSTILTRSRVCLLQAQNQNKSDLPSVYVEQSLGPPDANRVLALEEFLIATDFEQKIGSASPDVVSPINGLEDALWVAGDMLSGLPQGSIIRVMVMTRDQFPGSLSTSIKARAENIGSKGGILQLAPLFGPEQVFDIKQFWAGLLSLAAPRHVLDSQQNSQKQQSYAVDEDEERILSISDLSAVVRMKAYRKRAITRINWSLGNGGPTIGVKLFATSQSAWPGAKGATEYVHSMDTAPLVKVSTTLDMGTGIPLEKGQVPRRYYPKYNNATKVARLPGKTIYATVEEIKQLKSPITKGMSLLGFKPRSDLESWHQWRAATFCYPDEATVSGSLRAFAALHAAMLERDVIAVSTIVQGPSADPRLVAMLPQEETRDRHTGAQINPPGFYLIHLPFADDVRWPEKDTAFTGAEKPTPSNAAVEAASELIEKFKLEEDFDPVDICNPHLQRWFEVLEQIAIRREEIAVSEEPLDLAKPDLASFSEDATASVEKFIVSLFRVIVE